VEPFLLEITTTRPAAGDGEVSTRRVVVRGEVDMSSASQLAAYLIDELGDGVTSLVVDASDVTFLDSTGLRVLVDVSARLDAIGGRLIVGPMSPSVRRVLEMTGLLERYSA